MSCIKEGPLQKWAESKKTYKTVYAKLLSSGLFQWFKKQGSDSPKRSVDVKTISAFLAFGTVIKQVPSKLPYMTDVEIERSFIVPDEPHNATKITLFMCNSPEELRTWIVAMSTFLPGSGPYQGPVGSDFIPPQQAPQALESGNYGYPPGGASYPGVPPIGASYTGLPQPGYTDFPSIPGVPFGGQGYPASQPAGYPPAPVCSTAPWGSYLPPQSGAYPQPLASGFPAPRFGYAWGSRIAPPAVGGYPSAAVGGGYGAPMGAGYGAPMGAAGYQQQPYMVDKKGKPYTIVYKNGKAKKKKLKKTGSSSDSSSSSS